jgi:putative transposase
MIAVMTRKTTLASGEYYHVYNRGVEKRIIFSSKSDYQRFLSLLYLCNSIDSVHIYDHFKYSRGLTSGELLSLPRTNELVDICAYCLMPNHFHLLIKEKEEGGISKFMQKIMTGYTMYFNKIHDRSGSLFQGTFKAEHAKDDNYLKYLISYIHLNPIKLIESKWKETGITNKRGAEKFLNEYPYSSYIDYIGTSRKENILINKKALPDYFETPKKFKENVTEWLNYKKEQ